MGCQSFICPHRSTSRAQGCAKRGFGWWLGLLAAWGSGNLAAAQELSAVFDTPGGNPWWVEVYVAADSPLRAVEARADGGAWRPLSLQPWGAFAASFPVGDDARVEFQAHGVDGSRALSGTYAWPAGLLFAPAVRGATDAWWATFDAVRGNPWWVETDVASSRALAAVEVQIDDAAFFPLEATTWGSYAASRFIPDGARVVLRARAVDGATVTSRPYLWPSATVIDDDGAGAAAPTAPVPQTPVPQTPVPQTPASGTPLAAPGLLPPSVSSPTPAVRFAGVRGNAWWVETEVYTAAPLAAVTLRIDEGAWQKMFATDWGSFAASTIVPPGSVVRFQAVTAGGLATQSGGYRWPDAVLVAEAPATTPSPLPAATLPGAPERDVVIAIDARYGPHGGPPVWVDRGLYSMNLADWLPGDYDPPHPDFLAYLRALRPGFLRAPAGHRSQEYIWPGGGSGQTGVRTLTPDEIAAFLSLCDEVGATPLFGINLKTGTPESAADLVRHLNIERGYGVTWFQMGNEPDYSETPSPEVHAARHNAFARAMREVDPNIRLVGPELLSGAHVLGLQGAQDWMTAFLIDAEQIDGVSWHWYPLWSGQTNPASSGFFRRENAFQEEAPDWNAASLNFADQIMPTLARRMADNGRDVGIWLTEFALDSGDRAGAGVSDTLAGALWAADAFGRFAGWGPAVIARWSFHGSAHHAYALLDRAFVPRPEYYTYWLYARHFGDRIVAAESSARSIVNAHAALRSDGALAVMLVNKSSLAQTVALSLTGFGATRATRYRIEGDGLSSTRVRLNGQALTPASALDESIDAVPDAETLVFTLPPHTVELRLLR